MDLDPRRLLDELQPAKTIIVMAARYCKYLCQIGYENSRKEKNPTKTETFRYEKLVHIWNNVSLNYEI